MMKPKRVLAIGAHTDDIELGCGATLHRLQKAGARIVTLAFSRAEDSRPPGTEIDILENEYRAAMATLGLADSDVLCGRIPVRRFSERRQEILEKLISVRRDFDPDLVLSMGSNDTHQDHSVVHQESVRAFRNRTLICYHSPWNERLLHSNLFVSVADEEFRAKMAMLAAYKSQVDLERPYFSERKVKLTMEFYGQQCGKPLAEAFEVYSAIVE